MIEKVADKILDMLDNVRWTKHEIDYLAWSIVNKSSAPIMRRVVYLSNRIIHHHNTFQESTDDTLF